MMFLDDKELQSLTGKSRRSFQVTALNAMGIEHKLRPDGHIIVLRSHVESLLNGGKSTARKNAEPDWGYLNA